MCAVADRAELPGGLCPQSLTAQACRHGFYVKGVTLITQFIRQAWGTVTLAVKGINREQLQTMITESGIALDISCDNTPRQQVIGGTQAALNEFATLLMAAGYEPVKLGVSGAWHTRLMEDGVQAMRDYLAGLDIASPEHQVLMNVTAKSEVAPSIIKENLLLHLTHTVKWTESFDTFLNMPTPVAFLEISNKPYLGNMLNDFAGVDQQRVMHCRKAFSDAKVFK